MVHFRLLTRTRQVTEYSCGACALQALLSYWGKDVDETELMNMLHTTPEEGTYPEDIVRVARALGFQAEAKENLTLASVEQFTRDGNPMIVLGQAWRSERISPKNLEEDWDDGHYIVILGVDKDYVYFQDPYLRMSKGFMPRKTFVEHWHQVMGGDQKKRQKLIQLGIFIRGKKARRRTVQELSIAALDFERFGSVNLIITQFPRVLLPYDFLSELEDIWADRNIRPNAFIFLTKDKDGNLTGMEGSRLDEEQDLPATNALIAAITSRSVGRPDLAQSKAEAALRAAAEGDFGLSAGDIQRIAQKIPPDHSTIIILFENAWERKFREVAKAHGGTVVGQRLISPEALASAARKLGAAATSATKTGRPTG